VRGLTLVTLDMGCPPNRVGMQVWMLQSVHTGCDNPSVRTAAAANRLMR
jgi:hypothetical protein